MLKVGDKEISMDIYECSNGDICITIFDTNTNQRLNSGYGVSIKEAITDLLKYL